MSPQLAAQELAVQFALAGLHPLPRGQHPFPHHRGRLPLGGSGEFGWSQLGDFHHQIKAVEQGAADAVHIAQALAGGAATGPFGVAVPAAGAGVWSAIGVFRVICAILFPARSRGQG